MTTETERLASLIEAKHECLRQLRELGQKQLESIASADFSLLIKILAAKQRLLTDIQNIERQLDPFRNQPPENRDWSSTPKREHCASLAGQCESLLKAVVAQEKESERLLTKQRDEAAQQLQRANHASQARGAYAPTTDYLPSQIDLCSET